MIWNKYPMKTKARVVQICGTGSGVGKSVIVAGLCRLFLQDGFKVAPFKAQNMALNSAVTEDGLEIGRAQAMQAEACRIKATVDMNPILLKPTSDTGCQVVVRGRPFKNMAAKEYHTYKKRLLTIISQSLQRLMANYDLVVIEGAGSPAEVNLKSQDIVNLRVARMVGAPVILVGDIDKGGVFAWLVGTLQILTRAERALVKGLIINKFRGDLSLLESGLAFLEQKTKKKVLGVVPYLPDLRLPEEDSLFFEQRRLPVKGPIKIVIVRLPYISNFTDFDVLEREPEVSLVYTAEPGVVADADCIILPGTKNTTAGLQFLHKTGLSKVIQTQALAGKEVVGICGGYQILGRQIRDSLGVESKRPVVPGLGLLEVITEFGSEKQTYQVEGTDPRTGFLVKGYEIHHGRTERLAGTEPVFLISRRGRQTVCLEDGARNQDGQTWGTYLHGLFDNFNFRQWFLNRLRAKKGLAPMENLTETVFSDTRYDHLAQILRNHLDTKALYRIVFQRDEK
jgi:adenosylcobyric acid synthase